MDKLAKVFIEEVSNIIGGKIKEEKLFYYRLSVSGNYQGKIIYCEYIRKPREENTIPIFWFGLKPISVPKIKKKYLFFYPKITDKVILKKGLLVYKHALSSQLETTPELFSKIFDILVQAEDELKKKSMGSKHI